MLSSADLNLQATGENYLDAKNNLDATSDVSTSEFIVFRRAKSKIVGRKSIRLAPNEIQITMGVLFLHTISIQTLNARNFFGNGNLRSGPTPKESL